MPPLLQIPQTPRAKAQFDVQLQATPGSPSSADDAADAMTAADIDRRRKAPSPVPSLLHPARALGQLRAPDAFHRLSIGSVSDAGYGPSITPAVYQAEFAYSATTPRDIETTHPRVPASVHRFWMRNRAVFFVFFAQLFGALMNLFARLLERDEGAGAMHPVQLLFLRMVMTAGASCAWAWRYRVPDFPLGPPGVRWLLVIRGLTGFFGIFGMWYSIMYLPLAEATVFTFLSPSVTGYICHLLLKDPFTRTEQIASGVAFFGIILITRPLSFFGHAAVPSVPSVPVDLDGTGAGVAALVHHVANATLASVADMADSGGAGAGAPADTVEGATTMQRLVAVLVALLGVLGGSSAFTAIRAIGTRAHPLISVNYFSTWCAIVTGTVLLCAPLLGVGQPYLRFALPHSAQQYLLLVLICICGFGTQIFATMGLGLERSNRATAMMYTQMLFAASFDRFIFGNRMSTISLVGCGLVIGSALWAAMAKRPAAPAAPAAAPPMHPAGDVEAVPMLAAIDSDDEIETLGRASGVR